MVCSSSSLQGHYSLGVSSVEGWKQLRRMHQVPCSRCVYFTGDYNLKCTVRPCDALTEQAIDCRDFEVATNVLALRI